MNMWRRTCPTALIVLLAHTSGIFAQQEVLVRPEVAAAAPPAEALLPLRFPVFHTYRLSNGASVIVVPHDEQPVVSIDLHVIGPGRMNVPQGSEGLPALLASVLTEGTKKRTEEQIAGEVAAIGAQLSVSPRQEGIMLSFRGLADDMEWGVTLLAELVLEPTLPERALERIRERMAVIRERQFGQLPQVASRLLLRRAFGDHPYGRQPTPLSLRGITRNQVLEFYQTHVRPGSALVVVAGAISPAEVLAVLERHLHRWTGDSPTRPPFPQPAIPAAREILLVHAPGATQASIRIGHTLPPAIHADRVPLHVALHVLGGGPASMLYRALRQQRGYAYSTAAFASQNVGPGVLQLTADVRMAVADSALDLMLATMERLRDEPLPADKLAAASSSLTGGFPETIETPAQIGRHLAEAILHGHPPEDVIERRDRIAAVTAADVQRAAREHLFPDRAVIVIAGDATVLADRLARFGRVIVVDPEGRPL